MRKKDGEGVWLVVIEILQVILKTINDNCVVIVVPICF